MRRFAIASLHALLALSFLVGSVIILVQAHLNTRWELHFYKAWSDQTMMTLAVAVVLTAFASLQLLSSIGYVFGYRWAYHGLLVASLAMVVLLPPWLNVVVGMTGGLVMLDLIQTRRAAAEEPTA